MDEGGGDGGPRGCDGGESSRVKPSFEVVGGQRQRQIFRVELIPGETTIVSWKKLLKDAAKANGSTSAPQPPSNAHHALESRISSGQLPENEVKDGPPAGGRLSAVVEKIERLYVGKHSSDEEDLNDVPDDDDYDTEDSFIDDAELDEYFQVDNSAIKHDGFFVNRGKLERIEPTSSLNQQPKKRRRKDLEKNHGGNDDRDAPNKHVKVRKKAAGNTVPLVGKNSNSPSHCVTMTNVDSENVKYQDKMNASEICSKQKSGNAKTTLDPSPLRVSNGGATELETDTDKQKVRVFPSKKHGNKLKEGSESFNASTQRSNDKSSLAQCKSQHGRSPKNFDELDQSVQGKEENDIRGRSDINVPEGKNSMQTVKLPLMQRKEGSSIRSKSTMLEKTIRELEKMIAEYRPPPMEVLDTDNSSQAVKRRLPPEIKQKLAKVARLAQASQGKISKELTNRLMSIVGHLMQLRTLKRNLKVMVNMGLSAKQEKEDRFQQIKKEVTDMIKMRVPFMKSKAPEQQDGASDDFQETCTAEKQVLKGKCSMDDALGDKICDLYDLYVEGLDEDAGPQGRKLYAELAALWPSGFMDNHGIRRAICKAKDRRRTLYNHHKDQEKIKKKMLITKAEETAQVEANSTTQSQYIQEKLVTDSSSHGITSLDKPLSNTMAANTLMNGPSMDGVKQDKLKGISINSSDSRVSDGLMRKKVKRKPDGEAHLRPEKRTSLSGEQKPKSQKQVAAPLQKTDLNLPPPPSFEQLN